jgi:hypothetical protein
MRITKPNRKAQIITFDFSSSIIIFVIFIAIFIGLFLLSQNVEKKQEFELEYIYSNLENNLMFDTTINRDFFKDYRVDASKLRTFATDIQSIGSGSINSYVIGTIGASHGIGVDNSSFDICLYFTDNNRSIVEIIPGSGVRALGYLTKPASSCNTELTRPCDRYKQAVSVFKPVLFDENDYTKSRILQMNIVMCKK